MQKAQMLGRKCCVLLPLLPSRMRNDRAKQLDTLRYQCSQPSPSARGGLERAPAAHQCGKRVGRQHSTHASTGWPWRKAFVISSAFRSYIPWHQHGMRVVGREQQISLIVADDRTGLHVGHQCQQLHSSPLRPLLPLWFSTLCLSMVAVLAVLVQGCCSGRSERVQ
jgi:hypothetical protein